MSGLQQVNLFVDGLVPKREVLDYQQMLLIWCGFTVLLILWSGVDAWQNGSMQERYATKQQQLIQLKQSVDEMQSKLAGGKAALVQEVQALQEQRRAQSALALALAANQQQQGLSRALIGLSKSSIEGLWLSQITVLPNGLHLQGAATDAVILPRYIQRLSQQERFQGHSFAAVRLKLDEESQQLNFELRGPANSGAGS